MRKHAKLTAPALDDWEVNSIQPVKIDDVMEKLQTLSPERIAEVEDFIDFLKQRDQNRQLTQDAMLAAESSFQHVWDNIEDADYDRL